MHAVMVEAIPARALGALAIAGQVFFAVVGRIVVFSGHGKHLSGFGALQQLGQRIELAGFGRVRQIAGVNQEVRCFG